MPRVRRLQELVLRPRSRCRVAAATMLLILLPTLLRALLHPYLGQTMIFPTYYPAVMIAAVFFGWVSGVVTALGAALCTAILFIDPDEHGSVANAVLLSETMFALAAGCIILLAALLRQSLARLALEQQRTVLLNRELIHRNKNMLAIVQGLVFQTMQSSRVEPEEFYHNLEGRLQALGEAQSLLIEAPHDLIRAGDIVAKAIAPFDQQRFAVDVAACNLSSRSCIPLMLVLHELATNALKYGALHARDGCVRIEGRIDEARQRLELEWMEEGGPVVTPPARTGFGTRLLARQPGIEQVDMTYHPDGVRCTLTLPIAGVSEPRPACWQVSGTG